LRAIAKSHARNVPFDESNVAKRLNAARKTSWATSSQSEYRGMRARTVAHTDD
jgi:hypothetical protein